MPGIKDVSLAVGRRKRRKMRRHPIHLRVGLRRGGRQRRALADRGCPAGDTATFSPTSSPNKQSVQWLMYNLAVLCRNAADDRAQASARYAACNERPIRPCSGAVTQTKRDFDDEFGSDGDFQRNGATGARSANDEDDHVDPISARPRLHSRGGVSRDRGSGRRLQHRSNRGRPVLRDQRLHHVEHHGAPRTRAGELPAAPDRADCPAVLAHHAGDIRQVRDAARRRLSNIVHLFQPDPLPAVHPLPIERRQHIACSVPGLDDQL